MERKNNYVRISVIREGTARKFDGDPSELWLDQDIELEQLFELDPFEITPEVLDSAEQPELADPTFDQPTAQALFDKKGRSLAQAIAGADKRLAKRGRNSRSWLRARNEPVFFVWQRSGRTISRKGKSQPTVRFSLVVGKPMRPQAGDEAMSGENTDIACGSPCVGGRRHKLEHDASRGVT